MLNLDTEDWGEIFIGCAGGGDSELTLTADIVPAPTYGYAALQLQVTGMSAALIGSGSHLTAVCVLIQA